MTPILSNVTIFKQCNYTFLIDLNISLKYPIIETEYRKKRSKSHRKSYNTMFF